MVSLSPNFWPNQTPQTTSPPPPPPVFFHRAVSVDKWCSAWPVKCCVVTYSICQRYICFYTVLWSRWARPELQQLARHEVRHGTEQRRRRRGMRQRRGWVGGGRRKGRADMRDQRERVWGETKDERGQMKGRAGKKKNRNMSVDLGLKSPSISDPSLFVWEVIHISLDWASCLATVYQFSRCQVNNRRKQKYESILINCKLKVN